MINWLKTLPLSGTVILAIAPALMGFTNLSLSPSSPNINSQQISLKFPSGTDRGAPVTTGGGGTRGPNSQCLKVKDGELSLNALTPNYSNSATTASATPTLYYYIPPTSASEGEFVLTDLNQKPIYQKTVKLPTQSGIMKLKVLPQTPLSPDQYYQWSFKIICNSQQRDKDIVIEGNLEYQPFNESVVNSDDSLEKAKFYAKKGIWLETLDNMAQVSATSPSDWAELLQSVGLKEMIAKPLVECCQSSHVNNPTSSGLD